MDYQKEYQRASEEAASQKWDKARLWAERITFCIGSLEEIENPWLKKDSDPATVYQLSLRFVDKDNVTHTVQATYKVSPELRILRGRFPCPWHNFKFLRYQTKVGSYGYALSQVSTDDTDCPWEKHWAARKAQDFARDEKIATPVDASPPLAGFDEWDTEALQAPITEVTQNGLLRAATLMFSTFQKRIDPGDFDTMTEGEGRKRLDALRAQWLTESANKAKPSL